MVMLTPCSPSSGIQAPEITIASPVIEQMIMVSKNVPVMQISPCCAGCEHFAAAAAIGADPSPASFEKMPRAMPFCIAMNIEPMAPPVTACGLNAASTIVAIAPGTFSRLPRINAMQAMT